MYIYIILSNHPLQLFSRFLIQIAIKTSIRHQFSTLTKNLTTLLVLLSTCQHLLKNGFQTILPMKKYLKKQLFITKIH